MRQNEGGSSHLALKRREIDPYQPPGGLKIEKPITNKIIDAINELPGREVRKRRSSGSTNNTGEPDVTGTTCVRLGSLAVGIRLEIEVKQPGKKPTALQYSKLKDFRRLGAIAFWADSVNSALEQLFEWELIRAGKRLDWIGFSDLKKKGGFVVRDLAA